MAVVAERIVTRPNDANKRCDRRRIESQQLKAYLGYDNERVKVVVRMGENTASITQLDPIITRVSDDDMMHCQVENRYDGVKRR